MLSTVWCPPLASTLWRLGWSESVSVLSFQIVHAVSSGTGLCVCMQVPGTPWQRALMQAGLVRKPGLKSNRVRTAKYTVVSFLPINLFQQFCRVANMYFLFIAALQLIPGLSPTSWVTTVGPLCFVLIINALKVHIYLSLYVITCAACLMCPSCLLPPCDAYQGCPNMWAVQWGPRCCADPQSGQG